MSFFSTTVAWQLFVLVAMAHLVLFLAWTTCKTPKTERLSSLAFLFNLVAPPASPSLPVPGNTQAQFKRMPARMRTSNAGKKPVDNHSVATALPATQAADALAPAPTYPAPTDVPLSLGPDVRLAIKDVQRDMPNRIQSGSRPDKSSFITFEKNVSAAARPRGMTYQNFVLPDGSPMTKVTTSSGSYCVISGKSNAVDFG